MARFVSKPAKLRYYASIPLVVLLAVTNKYHITANSNNNPDDKSLLSINKHIQGNNVNDSNKNNTLQHPPSMDPTKITFDSLYFPNKSHYNEEPHANVQYNLNHPFSSIINGYKLAEIPSSPLLRDLFKDELDELNKFSERKMVEHKFVHSKEYMRFHVTLKPFQWLEDIPLINYIFDISITAQEDWIIDWDLNRAECLITNETFRWSFSVDEMVIIQGVIDKKQVNKINKMNQFNHDEIKNKSEINIDNNYKIKNNRNNSNTALFKALYVSSFIPIPSIMFWNYKEYSDSYINIITQLASVHSCSSNSGSS